MTYFRTGTPYYHRRAADFSGSCSGWEGVVSAGVAGNRVQVTGNRCVRRVALAKPVSDLGIRANVEAGLVASAWPFLEVSARTAAIDGDERP